MESLSFVFRITRFVSEMRYSVAYIMECGSNTKSLVLWPFKFIHIIKAEHRSI